MKRDHAVVILEIRRRRLLALEQQAALQGKACPTHVFLAIEDLRREIEELENLPAHTSRQHRLAAILFTDMKGFSKKTQEDENMTLELLDVHNRMMEMQIAKHDGRTVKTIGDAFMVEFASAVKAVTCALEAQHAFAEYNSQSTEDWQLEIRMGVHAGEIVAMPDGDLFGATVNVAARLEPLAPVGGVCVSELVYEAVRRKVSAVASPQGTHELKNVGRWVLYHLRTCVDWQENTPSLETGSSIRVGSCPYKGLDAFDEGDAEFFFGREKEIKKLLAWLHGEKNMIALIGASGAGKSSLLLAGLLPSIRQEEEHWAIVRMRPKSRPVHELARVLTLLRGGGTTDFQKLEKALLENPRTISDYADLYFSDGRLLLAIDQFEEVFTLAGHSERDTFLEGILHAVTEGENVSAVVTLRADFLGSVLEQSVEIAHVISDCAYIVRPMTAEQLHDIVERPAGLQGVQFEEGLVDTLVHEVKGQPGDLPLLQFTLKRIWEKRAEDLLTWECYKQIGELRGAITKWADAFLASLTKRELLVVRRIFGRLVLLGEGAVDTKQRVEREDIESLFSDAESLLDRLIGERLLTAYEDGVEIAHEALLREWKIFRDWLESDREALRLQQTLARTARQWERDGRQEADLLRGVRLARYLEMNSAGASQFSRLEKDFLETSKAAEKQAIEEDEVRRQRELESSKKLAEARLRSTRSLSLGLAIALGLLVCVAILASVALQERQRAQESLSNSVEVANLISLKIDRDLETVAGASKIRRTLLEEATELLERLTEGRGNDGRNSEVLKSRVILHNLRGNLALTHDDLSLARREYGLSLDSVNRLLEKDPNNEDYQRDLSISRNKIGDILRAQGNLEDALSEYLLSLQIREKLVQENADDTRLQVDLSTSYNKIGDILRTQGHLDLALQRFRSSFDLRRGLLEKDPDNFDRQRDLSISHERIGDILKVQGDLEGALREFRATLLIREALAEQDPENATWRYLLSISRETIGDVFRAQGNYDRALSEYRASFREAEYLADQDPENTRWQRDLSVIKNRIGITLQEMGDYEGALRDFRDSLDIRQRLVKKDPDNAEWRYDLSFVHERIGDSLIAQGDLSAALREFRASFEMREILVEQDSENSEWKCGLAGAYWRLAYVTADSSPDSRIEVIRLLEAGLAILYELDELQKLPASWQEWVVKYENSINTAREAQGEAFQADSWPIGPS